MNNRYIFPMSFYSKFIRSCLHHEQADDTRAVYVIKHHFGDAYRLPHGQPFLTEKEILVKKRSNMIEETI